MRVKQVGVRNLNELQAFLNENAQEGFFFKAIAAPISPGFDYTLVFEQGGPARTFTCYGFFASSESNMAAQLKDKDGTLISIAHGVIPDTNYVAVFAKFVPDESSADSVLPETV